MWFAHFPRSVFRLTYFWCKLPIGPYVSSSSIFLMFFAHSVDSSGNLGRDTMSGEEDTGAHESWAKDADVHQLLGYMLAQPFADHSTAVHANLSGELRIAHAVGLLRLANSLDFGKANWRASSTRNKGVVYHTWLYHFLRSSRAKLRPPPAFTTTSETLWSCNLRTKVLAIEKEFKREVERIEKAIRRSADAVAVSGYEAELVELRCRLSPSATWLPSSQKV